MTDKISEDHDLEMSDENSRSSRKQNPRRKKTPIEYILILLIIFCVGMALQRPIMGWLQNQKAEELRLLAEKESQAQPETTVEATQTEESVPQESAAEPDYQSPIDFEALRKINPDIVGWLKIPGTRIDYPVVQTDNNETYLKKTFEGGQSAEGTIYLDSDSDGDLMGYHSILYGHHMKNKSMFTDIVKFKEKDFFEANREIILYTPEREIRLKTIAALYGNADGEKRRTKFKSQETFEAYIDNMTKDCSFRELPSEKTERLYSFVTCSYEFENARTILYAVPEEN